MYRIRIDLSKEHKMIRISITFFVLALVAYVLGANGIAGVSLEIGKLFLIIFLVLAVLSYLVSLSSGRNTKLLP